MEFFLLPNTLLFILLISFHAYALPPAPAPAPSPKPPVMVLPPIMPPTMPIVLPPVMPPMMPTVLPPIMPPMPPVKPPMMPPGKPVAVLGAVFCESACKYMGVYNKVTRVSPLQGAVVELGCNNTNSGPVELAKTDPNGYFLITPPNLTADGVGNCRVFLVNSPDPRCNVPTKLNGGSTGATLTPAMNTPIEKRLLAYDLYNVGPFSFQNHRIRPCRD